MRPDDHHLSVERAVTPGIRAGVATLSLTLLATAVLATRVDLGIAGPLASLAYVFVGVGSAPLLLAKRITVAELAALAPTFGLGLLIIVAFLSVEIPFWHPVPVGVAIAVVTAMMHIRAIGVAAAATT